MSGKKRKLYNFVRKKFELNIDDEDFLDTESVRSMKKGFAKAAVMPLTTNPVAVTLAVGKGIKETYKHGKAWLKNRHKAHDLVENAPRALTKNEKNKELRIAATSGKLEDVIHWLDQGADINTQSQNDGATPLIRAAQYGKIHIVKYLIENDANINRTQHDGKTPLIKAAEKGYTDIVNYLTDKGANVNREDAYGKTASYYAKKLESKQQSALLARPEPQKKPPTQQALRVNEDKQEALQDRLNIAAASGNVRNIKLALRDGAAINAKGEFGSTALDIAVQNNRWGAAECLIKNGARVDMKSRSVDRVVNKQSKDVVNAFERGYKPALALLSQPQPSAPAIEPEVNVQPLPSAPVFEPEVVVNENRPPLNIEPVVPQPQQIQPEVVVDAEDEKQNEAEASVKYLEKIGLYDSITDPVSFEVMQDPRILGEHSFDISTIECLPKLDKAQDGSFKIENPMTRKLHHFASVEEIKNLPKNFALISIIDVLNNLQQGKAHQAQAEKQQPVEQRSFSQRFGSNQNNQKDGAFLG